LYIDKFVTYGPPAGIKGLNSTSKYILLYSLECGLSLDQEPLLKLWDMFINQKHLKYLPQISNYLMERPTIDRKFLGERLAQTLTIATECSKLSKKPEIIRDLLPSLLSIDPR
jgi:hypothetical protein